MDLNRSINLELKFNKEFLDANIVQIGIGLAGAFLTVTLAYLSYDRYERFGTLEETKALMAQLDRSKQELKGKIEDQNAKHSLELQSLKSAPKSKTQLQAAITNQAEKYKVKVVKLMATEPLDKGRAETMELEFQGPYNGIRGFLSEIATLIGSSQIEKLRLSPSSKSNEVIATLSIVYLNPAVNLVYFDSPQRLTRQVDFSFDSFANWSFARTQFVPSDQKDIQKSTVGALDVSTEGEAQPLRNPFETPPKNQPSADGAGKNSIAERIESSEKKLNAYYLSGIIYSPNKRLCAITLPAGETKIFIEGQAINSRIKILKIEKTRVTIDAGKRLEIKVGDEIPL